VPTIGAYVAITWCRITVHISDLGACLHGLEERINEACSQDGSGGPMRCETGRPGRQPDANPRGINQRFTFLAVAAVPAVAAIYGNLALFEEGKAALGTGGIVFDLVLFAVVVGAYNAGFGAVADHFLTPGGRQAFAERYYEVMGVSPDAYLWEYFRKLEEIVPAP
jgi:hypothetical protein